MFIFQSCQLPGISKELMQFWNNIHYCVTVRRLILEVLTSLQRLTSRKRC